MDGHLLWNSSRRGIALRWFVYLFFNPTSSRYTPSYPILTDDLTLMAFKFQPNNHNAEIAH